VRRLVQRLHNELKLPVFVLVDNDPWGFYIYSVMKQGSINLAFESMRLAVPDARFIGLSSFDKDKYKLPTNVSIRMTDGDNVRAKQMLAYPWFKHAKWQREIQEMVRSGLKFEIQALSRHGISFITEEYLPRKLKDRDWLEERRGGWRGATSSSESAPYSRWRVRRPSPPRPPSWPGPRSTPSRPPSPRRCRGRASPA
jgi:DNA topoisomerase-6 subunit A